MAVDLGQELKVAGLDVAKYAANRVLGGPLLDEAMDLLATELKKVIPGQVDDAVIDFILAQGKGPLKAIVADLIAKIPAA